MIKNRLYPFIVLPLVLTMPPNRLSSGILALPVPPNKMGIRAVAFMSIIIMRLATGRQKTWS